MEGGRMLPPPPRPAAAPPAAGDEPAALPPPAARPDDPAEAGEQAGEEAAPPRAAGTYEPPPWGGPPDVGWSLEVLKGGAVVDCVALEGRGHWTLGRSPDCQLVLEHPSASRLHAALQFKPGAAGEVFLFDCGSTHGSFVNKRRLRPGAHAPLAVGDQLRFGASSRAYVLLGPAHLAPAEGLSREERRQLRQLEAAAAAADDAALRAMALVKARARLTGGEGGASWGQSLAESGDFPDEEHEAPPPGEEVDWRTHAGKLSEKQAAARDKLLAREAKLANLASEVERIQAKEAGQQGLTEGQAAQVRRNEERARALRAELEEAGEALNAVLAAAAAERARAAGAPPGPGPAAARRARGREEEEEAGGSDSDEYYDRTCAPAAKRRQLAVAGGGAETVQSLWAKREAARAQAAAARAQAEAAAAGAPAPAAEDELEAYMAAVDAQQRAAAAQRQRAEAEALEAEEARLGRLIALADPDGRYKGPGAAAAPPPPKHAAQRAAAAALAASVFGEKEPPPQPQAGPAPAAAAPPSAIRQAELALAGVAVPQQAGLVRVRRPEAAAPRAQPSAERLAAAAEAAALADVYRLLGGGGGGGEDEGAAAAGAEWRLPSGQKGDGRTRANDVLGY